MQAINFSKTILRFLSFSYSQIFLYFAIIFYEKTSKLLKIDSYTFSEDLILYPHNFIL